MAGHFTRRGADGEVTQQHVGNLLLDNINFFREYTVDSSISAAARTQPSMRGSGRVRDLRVALSLGTPQAEALQVCVTQVVQASTRDAQRAAVDALLHVWGATSDMATSLRTNTALAPAVAGTQAMTAVARFAQDHAALSAQIETLERFNGSTILDRMMVAQSVGASPRFVVRISAEQQALLGQAYAALHNSVYGALALQTRLKPYVDSTRVEITADGVRFDDTALRALLEGKRATDARQARADLVDLSRYAGAFLAPVGFDARRVLANWIAELPYSAELQNEFTALGIAYGTTRSGSRADDAYFGSEGDNYFAAAGGDDYLDGGSGNDTLNGDAGNDTLLGGSGNDTLNGGAGDDTVRGGAGNDEMSGGAGNNTFHFERGDGNDTIKHCWAAEREGFGVLQFGAGILPSDIRITRHYDTLVLTITGSVETAGTELPIESVRVAYCFFGDTVNNRWNPITEIRFQDGTVWSRDFVSAAALVGTDAAQTLIGYDANDTINAQGGNDVVDGRAGDDTLDGGKGNDTLRGGEGNDILHGGSGNDTLNGDAGSNTYVFGRGDGRDTIGAHWSRQDADVNVLQFGEGIAASDVVVLREGGQLTLALARTSDAVCVTYFFSGGDPLYRYNPLNRVRFHDGTSWSVQDIRRMALIGNDSAQRLTGYLGDDTIHAMGGDDTVDGQNGDDTLDGGDGHDVLYGGEGNDTLTGGAGNDHLSGGAGSNTYVFGRGDGRDTIVGQWQRRDDDVDTLQLGAGVGFNNLWFDRSGSDLRMGVMGSADQVVLYGWYWQNTRHVSQLRTADGNTLDRAGVIRLVQAMASFGAPTAGHVRWAGSAAQNDVFQITGTH